MSNYDPFRLYVRSQRSSHKGQVLRKKYYPYFGNAWTDEDLNRVMKSLEDRGYNIFPPGAFPSVSNSFSHDTVGIFNIGAITFPSPSPSELAFSFSTLWNVVEPEFSEILDASPDSITQFSFRIDIISINSWGVFELPSYNSNNSSISLYFQDSSKSITYMPSCPIGPGSRNHLSLQSLNNQTLLNFSHIYNYSYTEELSKKEGLDSPYLVSYIETDPTIIVALKNKDYSVFNPILFNFVYSGSQTLPLTIPNTSACFHLHLEYDTK